jgi:hypothetical protein
MWNRTVVAEANPVIVFGVAFAGITCFKSKPNTELAAIDTAGNIITPSILTVAVAEDAALLEITIFVTTVVVLVLGTVYRVALEVAAAVLARTLEVTAISYCSFREV